MSIYFKSIFLCVNKTNERVVELKKISMDKENCDKNNVHHDMTCRSHELCKSIEYCKYFLELLFVF